MKAQGKLSLNQIDLGLFNGELGIEASPVQLQGEKDGDYWLPSYFTQWNGTSLVLPDPTRDLLNDVTPPIGMFQPVDLDKVPLRYGRSYEFRVRLADLTSGGPGSDDAAVNRSSAGIGSCLFRRFVPPKSVSFSDPQLSADGRAVTYDVFRPLLGYPGLVFSDFPNARQALIDDVAKAKTEKREVGLPDPDVTLLRVDVAVGSVEFDPANLPEEGEPLRPLYTAVRSFPADPKSALALTFQYRDAPDIAVFPSPGPTEPLALPTGRNIRVILTPIARPDPASGTGAADPVLVPNPDGAAIDSPDPQLRYLRSQAARVGLPSTIRLRRESDSETGLLRDLPGRPFQVLLLQPDPAPGKFQANVQATAGLQGQTPLDLVQRLAHQLGLVAEGLFFTGRPGQRTIFGCSAALRHLLSPDHSGIAFATKADLTGHWITAIQLQLVRDWTWDSLNDTGFEVRRNLGNGDELVGTLAVPRSVSALAVRPELGIDRSTTDLVFFDAIDPKPVSGTFPAETMVTYTVTPRFKQVPVTADWPWQSRIRLPIAAPPTQVPRLASAGIAFSPYRHDSEYSSTEPRRRMLWFEFAEPVQNPRDAYFVRVLAQAADPLLVGAEPDQPPAPTEPPLPVDPELIRIITPGQPDDSAGLDAMQQLALSAGDSARHFLIPLPPNLPDTAPELFGFFTYEVRIGHAQGWSTAQARFGLPLRVTGVQHPTPPLTCLVSRQAAGITASAPFALPVANGQVLLSQRPFQTQIWILLYAQVLQADGVSSRNVLLGQAPAQFQAKTFDGQTGPQPHGVAHWDQADLLGRLAALNLSADASLSVLAVEFLPEPSAAFADPLSADLGQVRILRTSPLTPVNAICVEE